jgi:hypothetical protein
MQLYKKGNDIFFLDGEQRLTNASFIHADKVYAHENGYSVSTSNCGQTVWNFSNFKININLYLHE